MKREKHLESILAIVLGLAVIYWFKKNQYLVPAIILISAVGLLSPWLTEKIHLGWMKIAHIMGAVMSKVILSVLFYLFLYPLSLLSKLFSKKDLLQLKKNPMPPITKNVIISIRQRTWRIHGKKLNPLTKCD